MIEVVFHHRSDLNDPRIKPVMIWETDHPPIIGDEIILGDGSFFMVAERRWDSPGEMTLVLDPPPPFTQS